MTQSGRPRASVLTDSELDVMHTFWESGDLSANESCQILVKRGHVVGVTNVTTSIQSLAERGYLRQVNDRRPRRFRAIISLHEVSGRLLEEFIDRVYAGSRTPLLLRLMQEVQLTGELRQRLEQFLEGRDDSSVADVSARNSGRRRSPSTLSRTSERRGPRR